MKVESSPKNRVLLWTLTVLIALGGFLRLFRIEEKMRFIWDEGRDMLAIRQMIVDRDLLLLGPFNERGGRKDFFGVFHYYLMAPSLWAANLDPVGPAVFTALLGTASIGLVYWLVKEWEDPKIALIVTAIYAVSPLVIKYVQWPWNPNTVPFFSLLYGLCITKIHQQQTKQWPWHIGAGLLLGLLFQLHYFTIALGIWWLLIVLFQQLDFKKFLKRVCLFGGGFLFPNLSFIFFDLRHDFFLSKIFRESFTSGSTQQLFDLSFQSIISLWTYLTGVTTDLLALPEFLSWPLTIFWLVSGYFSIKHSLNTRKFTLSALVFFTWVILLSILTVFPSLKDDYHSSYLWFGTLLLIIKPLKAVLKIHWPAIILVTVLYTIHLIRANHLQRSPDWSENLPAVKEISSVISNDILANQISSFNIVDLSNSDSKATRYRYFLTVNKTEPFHPDRYPEAMVLYAISQKPLSERLAEPIWELSSFVSAEAISLGTIDNLIIYKLTKK